MPLRPPNVPYGNLETLELLANIFQKKENSFEGDSK